MDMDWLESVLYGLLAGFTEFLPVSAQAHRAILLGIFGAEAEHPVMGLFIHIGIIAALYFSCKLQLRKLYREYRLTKAPRRRRRRFPDLQSMRDISLFKTACIPLIFGFFLYTKASAWGEKLYMIALFLLLNGLILYVPMFLPQGNKDSRSMSRLDGVLIGLGAAASILPGVSRVGAASSAAIARGADMQQAYKWSLLLSFPALLILTCFDCYSIITVGLAGIKFIFILQCLLSACVACLGAYLGITFMKVLATRTGFFNFSYYCWGAALFVFILYLI